MQYKPLCYTNVKRIFFLFSGKVLVRQRENRFSGAGCGNARRRAGTPHFVQPGAPIPEGRDDSMKEHFSVSEAAKMVNMTAETLRHYDRIGLVKPGFRDGWTGYRYYTRQEIIRLNTIHALRYMDLSLAEIKRVLELDNLEEVVAFLKTAEQKADEKMARLQYAKEKIQLARGEYEKKLTGQADPGELFLQSIGQRVILLSDRLHTPTLDNLWQYHRHFYEQLEEPVRQQFAFADLAGIYTKGESSRLFAVCIRYPDVQGLTILPAGRYLCAACTEENRPAMIARLTEAARSRYGAEADWVVQLIVVTGILQWDYQLQVLVAPNGAGGLDTAGRKSPA